MTLFTEFHGLSENPFTNMPSPHLAWLGGGMCKVRAELCEAVLQGSGLMVLSGGPGVGKSLALKLLASDLKQSGAPCRIHALNWGLQNSVTELLRRIAEDAPGGDGASATDRLTVLLIDEAQHLGAAELGALLQEAALTGDRLRLVLAGAPELVLAVNEALVEHPVTVATHWSLEPLPPDEISSYIVGRLQAAGGGRREIFTAGAIKCLTRHSGGVPRRLNVLCSTALFLASREGRQDVDASIVEASLPTFSSTGPLNDAAEPRPRAPLPTSTQVSPIETAEGPEAKHLPMAEVESAAIEVAAEPAALDGVQSEVMEFVTARAAQSESIALLTTPPEAAAHGPGAARLETCEDATDVAFAATPASREFAEPQPKAKPFARQHSPVWAQIRRRHAIYVPVAGIAAIVFLLVAIDWRGDEPPTPNATAPMTAVTILPADPSIIAATNQPTAPSQAAEPVVAEKSPTPAMRPANGFVPQSDGQMASATESVDPLPVYAGAPQFTGEEAQSADEGGSPPGTIGPEELAELLARARQQIEAFALTTPAGDNALETLQRVLAAMPAQPDALQGIRDIASKYAVLAAQANRRGEYGLAKRYLDKGLGVVPDHPDLLVNDLIKLLRPEVAQQVCADLPSGATRAQEACQSDVRLGTRDLWGDETQPIPTGGSDVEPESLPSAQDVAESEIGDTAQSDVHLGTRDLWGDKTQSIPTGGSDVEPESLPSAHDVAESQIGDAAISPAAGPAAPTPELASARSHPTGTTGEHNTVLLPSFEDGPTASEDDKPTTTTARKEPKAATKPHHDPAPPAPSLGSDPGSDPGSASSPSSLGGDPGSDPGSSGSGGNAGRDSHN